MLGSRKVSIKIHLSDACRNIASLFTIGSFAFLTQALQGTNEPFLISCTQEVSFFVAEHDPAKKGGELMLVLSIIAIVLAGVAVAGVGLNLLYQLRAERTLGQLEERHSSQRVSSEEATHSPVNGSGVRSRVS